MALKDQDRKDYEKRQKLFKANIKNIEEVHIIGAKDLLAEIAGSRITQKEICIDTEKG